MNIIQREQLPPKATDCVHKIDNASRHLLSLVNDVLDMTRIESGKSTLLHEPIDLRMLVDNCDSIISGQMEGRDLRYSSDCSAVEHERVLGDELRIRQILINIMGNAVKFTPDGGSIRLTVRELSSEGKTASIQFSVADTGIGMKPEFIPHIFDAFAQEEEEGSRTTYKGSGLGMSITKQLVDMMKGEITVVSTVGVGSTFTVTIPMEINLEERKLDTVRDVPVSIEGIKVLLVEDNELNMEIAQTILEGEGVTVTPAENGRIAVEIFAANPPGTFDIILMDIMMPEMNGYEATRAIRSMAVRPDGATIPIFAMTANAFDEDRRNAIEAGMNSHIAKPIDFTILKRELAHYLKL